MLRKGIPYNDISLLRYIVDFRISFTSSFNVDVYIMYNTWMHPYTDKFLRYIVFI